MALSQLLPTAKCSSCALSVPLDSLGEHVCQPLPTRSPSTSSKHNSPRLKLHTSVAKLSTANPTSPKLPSTSPQDVSYFNRGPPRNTLTRRPSRNGIRSPPLPPSHTQTPPIVPFSVTLQQTPRHAATDSRPQSGAIPDNPHPNSIHTTSNPRRPSVPSTQLVQTPRVAHDPRSADHPIRVSPSPAPSNYSSHHLIGPEIDTKSGGAAGMAGVGRRGFAAAARAAMFAAPASSSVHPPTLPPPTSWNPGRSPPPIDARRAYPPRDVQNYSAAAPHMPYSYSLAQNSPPLRSSQDPRSRSSPDTQPSIISPTLSNSTPGRDNNAAIKSSSIPFPLKPSHAPLPSKEAGPLTPTSPNELSFSSSKKTRVASGGTIKVVTQDDTNSSFHMRASEDEESEFGGLAYAQSDDLDNDDISEHRMGSTPTRVHHSPSVSSSAYSGDGARVEKVPTEGGFDTVLAALLASPVSTDKILSPTSSTVSIPRMSKPPMRSLTSPTQRDSSSVAGAINRRAGTISGAIGGGSSDKSRRKERFSEESNESGLGRYREKVFTCMRCSKDIGDNRWIQVENGRGVLCGRCWKDMYLPKCRRCNLPIEKQAVSSLDGQLKGKYHRDCFNCHTCHKRFPDKTFYVFDGKPFCDYHYHEANNSLCAAPECGGPIEGPCAVSYAGDRYHPEHLTCEYEDETGRRCDERLIDYWEVEGRMVCERHMRRIVEQDMEDVGLDDVEWKADARALKRKTQFIDIAGLR